MRSPRVFASDYWGQHRSNTPGMFGELPAQHCCVAPQAASVELVKATIEGDMDCKAFSASTTRSARFKVAREYDIDADASREDSRHSSHIAEALR